MADHREVHLAQMPEDKELQDIQHFEEGDEVEELEEEEAKVEVHLMAMALTKTVRYMRCCCFLEFEFSI